MEIISLYALVAVVASLVGWYGFCWLKRRLRPLAVAEVKERSLAEHATRQELTDFLQKQMVSGDADIRDGIVHPPVPPEKLEPLAVVLGNAAAFLARLKNRAASSIYIRDSVNDRFMLLGDLDLDHLVDAARVMQRVAEDRRKSRSLYKGLTDDEMRAMIRSGMAHFYKTKMIEPEWAADIMAGGWDQSREFAIVQSVIELLFKVKGASND